MVKHETVEEKTKGKQKKTYLLLILGIFGAAFLFFYMIIPSSPSNGKEAQQEENIAALPSMGIDPEETRLVRLENDQMHQEAMSQALFDQQLEMKETLFEVKRSLEKQEKPQAEVTKTDLEQLKNILTVQIEEAKENTAEAFQEPNIVFAAPIEENDSKHVSAYIPAGTIVKCVLVSAADCSVGVSQAADPAQMLLRPLSNGKLPRGVRVLLRDSVLLARGVGDLANERVRIRADRMTLVKPNGDFIETEISAYISGEDGREGMRGVVVDRSGSIITRAAFASTIQGIASGIQATLNNQTLSKLSKESDSRVILDADTFRNAGIQGATTGLNKLADYYIKRAEQLQPSIQIAAGRVVDVIFTHGVKIGEKDLKKKFEIERNLSQQKKELR